MSNLNTTVIDCRILTLENIGTGVNYRDIFITFGRNNDIEHSPWSSHGLNSKYWARGNLAESDSSLLHRSPQVK